MMSMEEKQKHFSADKISKPTQVLDYSANHSLTIHFWCLHEKKKRNICSKFTQTLCEARGICTIFVHIIVTQQQHIHVLTHTHKNKQKKKMFLLEPIAQYMPLPALTEDKHQLDPRLRFPHRREQGRETIRSNLLVSPRGMV